MDWILALRQVVTFAVGSGVLAWLIRQLFKIQINKDFENFKHSLEQKQIKFTELHAKRANVIEEVYRLLDEFHSAMVMLTKPIQFTGEGEPEEKLRRAEVAGNNFVKFYSSKKIYFDKETVGLIEKLSKEYRNAWIDVTTYPHDSKKNMEKKCEYWRKAWKKIDKDVTPIKEKLENEFRDILGVNS